MKKIKDTKIVRTFEDGSKIITFLSEKARQKLNEEKNNKEIVCFKDGARLIYIPSQKER